jgi:hypothetical protein
MNNRRQKTAAAQTKFFSLLSPFLQSFNIFLLSAGFHNGNIVYCFQQPSFLCCSRFCPLPFAYLDQQHSTAAGECRRVHVSGRVPAADDRWHKPKAFSGG